MTNLARVGVSTLAVLLAGLSGTGVANAIPLANVGGEGTYAVGIVDPAQMFPGIYTTQGPAAGPAPCEWEIRTPNGDIRTEGKTIERISIGLAVGERLDTRNCASWAFDLGLSESTVSAIITSLGLTGAGSALFGTSLAAVVAAALATGNGFALEAGSSAGSTAALQLASAMALAFGSGSATGDGFGTGSGSGSDAGAGAAAGFDSGSAASILGRVIPPSP